MSDTMKFKKGKMISFRTHLQSEPMYYFGYDIVEELGPLLKQHEHDKVFLVTNDVLMNLYGREIEDVLGRNSVSYETIISHDSERDKSFENLEYLCETLVHRGVTKKSIVLSFGGGCLTNVVGLAAGILYRGIRYVEMTTTFMAMTDSSLSNRQAVNGRQGKHQFGIYYAPIFIFGDTRYLKTESISVRKSAIAEGIKNAFIQEKDLLPFYDEYLNRNLARLDALELTELAYTLIRSKLKILARDPGEEKYGMILEYGHTFGHAMEFCAAGKIPHGIAVARGMCIAAELSYRLGHLSREEAGLHYYYLGEKLGLDLTIPEEITVDEIMNTIRADNKKTAEGMKYVLLDTIGSVINADGTWQTEVDAGIVREVLTEYRERGLIVQRTAKVAAA